MRLIDGDELYREYQSVVCHDIACAECKAVDKDTGECRVDYLISDAPTIDAVSVVICENCRKSHIDGKTTHYLWCNEWGRSTDPFGYCERGEREGE